MQTTAELFEAVKFALTATGYTQEEIDDRDGPSSTTMTKLRGRTLEVTSEKTLRGLTRAFGWDYVDALALVDEQPKTRRAALGRIKASRQGASAERQAPGTQRPPITGYTAEDVASAEAHLAFVKAMAGTRVSEYPVTPTSAVGGLGQGETRPSSTTDGELTVSERELIGQAVGLLAQAVEILRQVAEPPPDRE